MRERLTSERLLEIRLQATAPRPSPLASDVLALVAEIRRAWTERDRLAVAVRDSLARLEPAGETCLCRDGSQVDVAMVRGVLRHALDTLAPEGGG